MIEYAVILMRQEIADLVKLVAANSKILNLVEEKTLLQRQSLLSIKDRVDALTVGIASLENMMAAIIRILSNTQEKKKKEKANIFGNFFEKKNIIKLAITFAVGTVLKVAHVVATKNDKKKKKI